MAHVLRSRSSLLAYSTDGDRNRAVTIVGSLLAFGIFWHGSFGDCKLVLAAAAAASVAGEGSGGAVAMIAIHAVISV